MHENNYFTVLSFNPHLENKKPSFLDPGTSGVLKPKAKMHRSSSGSRVSEDSVVNSAQQQSITTTTNDSDHHHYPLHLPTYDPLSHAAKRERSRIRSAENAIHLIPLVLVLCAIILWFFSSRSVQVQITILPI